MSVKVLMKIEAHLCRCVSMLSIMCLCVLYDVVMCTECVYWLS